MNFIDRSCRILEDLLPSQIFPNYIIEDIVNKAYKHFPEEGTPIVRINDNLAVAELFHGPSGSFKGMTHMYDSSKIILDFALQLFPYILRTCQSGDIVPPSLILGFGFEHSHTPLGTRLYNLIKAATSGDTGGALLAGLDAADLYGMYGIVLMPADGTSQIQKKQMLSFNNNPNIR